MEFIIDGKLLDTNEAESVLKFKDCRERMSKMPNLSLEIYGTVDAELFKTKNGRWAVVWHDGEKFRAKIETAEFAKKIFECWNEVELYKKHFGKIGAL